MGEKESNGVIYWQWKYMYTVCKLRTTVKLSSYLKFWSLWEKYKDSDSKGGEKGVLKHINNNK